MLLIASPTGSGKTTATAERVAKSGSTCWLADRHEDVDAAVRAIEREGGQVGQVAPLDGKTAGTPNCLHPDVIGAWQAKGYSYRTGYCLTCCERTGEVGQCPYLASLDALEHADSIVATKALARMSGFFSRMGNSGRRTVVLDEDPSGLLRPLVAVTRPDLQALRPVLDRIEERLHKRGVATAEALEQVARVRRIADWCWEQLARQPAGGQPEPVGVPNELRPALAGRKRDGAACKNGRVQPYQGFYAMMRSDPHGTLRNVSRDLFDLAERAAGRTAFATADRVFFHVRIRIPATKEVIVLDATGNPDLLRPLFEPRPVRVLCDQKVLPAGRVVQFMDFNGPRSYLNKTPQKVVRILSYVAKLREMLQGDKPVGNADVCRALGRLNGWGHRYWRRFLAENRDGLEGERKVKWKDE